MVLMRHQKKASPILRLLSRIRITVWAGSGLKPCRHTKDADVIFISHSHGDHFSIDDIRKLAKENTLLIVPNDCVKPVADAGYTNIVTALPSKSYEVDGLKFNTVPAYNIGKDFHKKDSNWLGFIVNVNGISYYFAGDTDRIPKMDDIKASVVFLPDTKYGISPAKELSTLSGRLFCSIFFCYLIECGMHGSGGCGNVGEKGTGLDVILDLSCILF